MTVLKPFILFCFIISGSAKLHAQTFVPLKEDSLKHKTLLDSITQKYKKDISGVSGPNSKYIIELYKERYENIKTIFDEDGIITNPEANDYLQSVVKIVYSYNLSLKSLNSRVLFSKAFWPNASSMGEGTILFNIGLFYKLENESQAAFVICHELAHLYLNQSNKAIEQYVNTIYSDEFQKELRTIQRSAYQKRQQLESLAKNFTFKDRRHSREHESEADSLAIEWLKNTPYDLNEALSCLTLLDSVDKDKYNEELRLEKYFNFPDYPFQAKWTRASVGLSAMANSSHEEDKKEADSLKTHPDCKVRVAKLES